MSIEAGIGAKTEKAIGESKDKPNLTSVFDDWKNNTSKAENQAERKSINDAVHKHLPNVTIINFGVAQSSVGEVKVVQTYDSATHKNEMRKIDDFSVVGSEDITNLLAANGSTDEQAIQILVNHADKDKAGPTEEPGKSDTPSKYKPENKDPQAPSVPVETKLYKIEPGDNLWKIAKREIVEANKANGKPESMPTPNEVKAFVDKIVLVNQTGDNAIKDSNLIYTGKTLNIPVEKPATPKTSIEPTTDAKKEEEEKASTEPTTDAKKEEEKSSTEPTTDAKPEPKPELKKDGDDKGNTNSESQVVPTVELKFTADAGTQDNPTIGGEEAAKESAVLKKYFVPMQKLFDFRSDTNELTAEEITEFVAKCKKTTAGANGQSGPSADELAILEKAATHLDRVASVRTDDLLLPGKGATIKDIDGFAQQEHELECRYQARFYLDKHFDRIAPGKDEVSVAEIRSYREQLAANPQFEAELKAVDNVLDQLAKAKVLDTVVLKKANAKDSIRDENAPPVENKEDPKSTSLEQNKVTPTPSSFSSSEPEFYDPKLAGIRVFN